MVECIRDVSMLKLVRAFHLNDGRVPRLLTKLAVLSSSCLRFVCVIIVSAILLDNQSIGISSCMEARKVA